MNHNFNADGFESLYPKYKGGRPRTFTLPERREIKKTAKSKPAEHGLPFSTWSLAKLADFLVAEGVVDDISHEGLRVLLREEGVSFQRVKTWKTSRDPDYAAKKARVEHLCAIADGEVVPEDGEPEVIFCMDEFGPLNLQPHVGRQCAERGGRHKDVHRDPRSRRRATYPGRTESGTCSQPWPRTSSTGTSRRRRTGRSSWSSAATCARCTRRKCALQRRDRLHPDQQLLAEPDRGPVHRPALLRPRRYRPSQPQGPGQHDPPLHHLAEQARQRPAPTLRCRQGERRLIPSQGTSGPASTPNPASRSPAQVTDPVSRGLRPHNISSRSSAVPETSAIGSPGP